MRHVQLEHVEAGRFGVPGGAHEIVPDPVHVGAVHLARRLRFRLVGKRRRRDQIPVAGFQRVVHALPAELRRALAPRMAELHAKLGAGLRVAEIHDALERVALRFVPQPRASRRNARFGRGAGHLDEHQARAADGTAAEMHQVPVVGHAVHRHVLVHGRDDNAVLQAHAAQDEGCEHRRRRVAHVDLETRRQDRVREPARDAL